MESLTTQSKEQVPDLKDILVGSDFFLLTEENDVCVTSAAAELGHPGHQMEGRRGHSDKKLKRYSSCM